MAAKSTALVPVTAKYGGAPGQAASGPHNRPFAPFLAHLIATATDAPQTRARRRIAPHIAAARYAATPARPTASIHPRSF